MLLDTLLLKFAQVAMTLKSIKEYLCKSCSSLLPKMLMKLIPLLALADWAAWLQIGVPKEPR
jgi:hypothetical protein